MGCFVFVLISVIVGFEEFDAFFFFVRFFIVVGGFGIGSVFRCLESSVFSEEVGMEKVRGRS